MKSCACGCGIEIEITDKQGRPHRFKRGHSRNRLGQGLSGDKNGMYGKKHSEETKEKMRQRAIGRSPSQETRMKISIGNRNKIISEETKRKISLANSGHKNYGWKGDKVSYKGLHIWIRNHLPRPEFCQICNTAKPKDVANISRRYLRDISDYQWLCRKCHIFYDRNVKH